jgi:hypothetical protein
MALEHLTLSEATVARLATLAAAVLALVAAMRRLAKNYAPDPWPAEVDAAVRNRQAVPACVNCLFPQDGREWFCPHCGFPTGDYVTLMPYLQNFALGETFRRGVAGRPEKGMGPKLLLVLASAAEYGFFAPLYWYWMIRKAAGRPIAAVPRVDLDFTADP